MQDRLKHFCEKKMERLRERDPKLQQTWNQEMAIRKAGFENWVSEMLLSVKNLTLWYLGGVHRE